MNRSRDVALPSSKKTHSERHKQILKQLLKEEGNRTCVDCKTTAHPRWASWNLGCFICIRCSGIHRSMGVHISKVKSVDLDAWTDEQVESMLKWGNEKCNSYWEAKLPSGYIPDQSKIENFIRTKYDLKKWVGSAIVPDPLKITVSKASNNGLSENQPSKPQANTVDLLSNNSTSTIKSTPAPSSLNSNLLDDDFGHFTSASSSTINSTKSSPIPPKSLPSLPTHNHISSPQSTGGSMSNGRPDLKKSILSLYSSPSSSTSSFVQPRVQHTHSANIPMSSPISASVSQPSSSLQTDSLSNSLQGLNFTTNKPSNSSSQSTINKPATKTWNNEWSDASTPKDQWSSSTPSNTINSSLDDDLFKNVWK